MNTPNTGVVVFLDDDGHLRQIDFLGSLAGIRETYYESIEATIVDEHDVPVATLRVMDPISCLKGRAHNVAFLPGYDTDHARDQLRASILCAKEFGRDLLKQDPFGALNLTSTRSISRATARDRWSTSDTGSTCSLQWSRMRECRRSSIRSGCPASARR